MANLNSYLNSWQWMGTRVKARRLAKGWTQKELVKQIIGRLDDKTLKRQVSLGLIKDIESGQGGKTPYGVLVKIAELLNTTTVYLITGKEEYLNG